MVENETNERTETQRKLKSKSTQTNEKNRRHYRRRTATLEIVLKFRHAIAVAGTGKTREALAASHDVVTPENRQRDRKRKVVLQMNGMLFDLDSATVDPPTPRKSCKGEPDAPRVMPRNLPGYSATAGNGSIAANAGSCRGQPANAALRTQGVDFQFRIHHTKSERTAIVGSSCIETYEGITPELVTRLTTDLDRLQTPHGLRIS